MKEITRIHIAKVTYEIEVAAKKRLESYIDALTNYADDENVVEDIEIRITELLETRGVKTGGIITLADIEAIQEILGEPKDFSGEGDFVIGDETADDTKNGKKFYRNIDDAVLGGVLSGLAAYMGVNPVWVRLLFVVLLFVSVGFAAFVYALLWVITPAAKTVTDKLLMKGEPVTLASIRKHNEDQVGLRSTKELLARRRKVFGVTVGVAGVFGVIGAAAATIGGVFAWLVLGVNHADYFNRWEVLALLIASGVFLTLLGVIISYAGFTARMTKKIGILLCSVIVAGVLSFTAAVSIVGLESWRRDDAIQKSITERSVTLPDNFSSIRQLVIDTQSVAVTYQVSTETRAIFSAAPGPKVIVKQDGDKAILQVTGIDERASLSYRPTLTIYGPEIMSVVVSKGFVDYAGKSQTLKAEVSGVSSLTLSGNYSALDAVIKDSGSVAADAASIRTAKLTLDPNTNIVLGTVESLDITAPVACPNNSKAQLSAQGIGTGNLTLNGVKLPAVSQTNSCWDIAIDADDDSDIMPAR